MTMQGKPFRVAAIDQGTTSTRCLVVTDEDHWHLAKALRHRQNHPAAGHVEHDPEELLANLRTVLAAAGQVDAIGLANQGESCLAWDALTGQALSPVIVWQDARTDAALAALPPDAHNLSRKISGLPLDPYFSASKFTWMLDHLPAVAAARDAGRLRLGTTDAFFLDRLAGTFATDVATASRTGLMDLATGDWSADLCALHRVPLACLPPIRACDAGFGTIDGVPVRASIVDQQAALFGHGCHTPGSAKVTFGTGAFLLVCTGTQPPQSGVLSPTVAWRRSGQATVYALEGGVYDAGAAIEWALRTEIITDLAALSSYDGPTALSRGLVFVPALSGLAAPDWDRGAAPVFIGMTHATTQQDLGLAVIEGVAMLAARLIAEAARLTPFEDCLSVDGGVSQSRYFRRFLAGATGRTIIAPDMHELTALGLADLCGVSVAGLRQRADQITPDLVTVSNRDHAAFDRALNFARGWRAQ